MILFFSFSELRTQLQRKMRRPRTRTASKKPMLVLCSASTLSISGRFPEGGGSQAGSSQAGRSQAGRAAQSRRGRAGTKETEGVEPSKERVEPAVCVSFLFHQRCFASGQWRCGPASRTHEPAKHQDFEVVKYWLEKNVHQCACIAACLP